MGERQISEPTQPGRSLKFTKKRLLRGSSELGHLEAASFITALTKTAILVCVYTKEYNLCADFQIKEAVFNKPLSFLQKEEVKGKCAALLRLSLFLFF